VWFLGESLRHEGSALFQGFQGVGKVLFVNTQREIELAREEAEGSEVTPALRVGSLDEVTETVNEGVEEV
jgi:hypothetical protein